MVVPFYMWLSRLIWAFNMETYRIITDSMGYSMAFMVEKLGGSSWVTECFMARLGGSSSSSMGSINPRGLVRQGFWGCDSDGKKKSLMFAVRKS